jgi:hypothetical protein
MNKVETVIDKRYTTQMPEADAEMLLFFNHLHMLARKHRKSETHILQSFRLERVKALSNRHFTLWSLDNIIFIDDIMPNQRELRAITTIYGPAVQHLVCKPSNTQINNYHFSRFSSSSITSSNAAFATVFHFTIYI